MDFDNKTKPISNTTYMYLSFGIDNCDGTNDKEMDVCRIAGDAVADKLTELGYKFEQRRGILSRSNDLSGHFKSYLQLDRSKINLSKLYPLITTDDNCDYSKLSDNVKQLIGELISVKTKETIILQKLTKILSSDETDSKILTPYL